jgi:hypothetical protein
MIFAADNACSIYVASWLNSPVRTDPSACPERPKLQTVAPTTGGLPRDSDVLRDGPKISVLNRPGPSRRIDSLDQRT